MKRITTYLIFLLLFLFGNVFSQEILTVYEKDKDGNYRDKENPGEIRDEFKNNKIADINSVLDIRIDHEALTAKVGTIYSAGLPDGLSGKISAIRLAMEQRNRSLENIREIVGRYDYHNFKNNPAAYDQYIADLQSEAKALTAILAIDERIRRKYFSLAGDDELYSGVYKAAEAVLSDLETEFRAYTAEKGVYIRFGGWLITKNQPVPIHLEGFDDITPQAPYEVDRWQFIPTKEQLEELESLKELARQNRDLGLSILKVTMQNQVDAIKAFGEMKFQEINQRLGYELQKLTEDAENITGAELRALINNLAMLQNALEGFSAEVKFRLNYYEELGDLKSIDVKEFLSHAESDIDYILNDQGPWIKNQVAEIVTGFQNLRPAFKELTDSTRSRFELLKTEITSELQAFEASAIKKAGEFLYGAEFDESTLEFGEEVYKLALSDLPSSVDLDLVYTGIRTDGDRIVLKMVVSDKQSPQAKTLESREIYLFRVLPHVITTVGVVFADPLAKTQIQTQFQMAPSFNFLFKGLGDQKCRRKSVAYNRLFDWGMGLHLSAPDFDKDDVPEIGAGVVVSTLHDYLQGGFAFNVFTGDPYWFFGLRFPIPSFNIGASSKVEME